MNTKQEFRAALAEFYRDQASQIYDADTSGQVTCQKITLDLSLAVTAANPFEISFPFKSLVFKNATGGTASINAVMNKNDSGISLIPFNNNDSFSTNRMFDKIFLSWTAQAGKTIDIVLFTNALFVSGSLINSGTISVSLPTTFVQSSTNLGAATAAIVAPLSSTRLLTTLQNQTGADLWVGDSTVTNAGATQGMKIAPDGIFTHKSSAAMYGYSVAGGRVNRIDET